MMTETLIVHGRIRTMDPAQPMAAAMLIRNGSIVALGPSAKLRRMASAQAHVIDAGGRLVLPGFQDAHVHFLSGGTDLATSAPLYEVKTLPELATTMAGHAARHPALPLVIGAGWQPGLFGDHNLTAAAIDAATGDRPAVLYDSSFHNACLNSAALRLAGIGDDTPDPPNGHFVRDASGAATGMLHEDAIKWALDRLPQLSDADYMAGLMAAQAHGHAHGLTGVLDPRVEELESRIYSRAMAENLLTIRVAGAALVRESDSVESALTRLLAMRAAAPGPMFHIHSAKFFMDGVFENRTAALLAPYADTAGGNAPCMFGQAQTLALMTALDAARFQIHVHVIGDAALRRSLDGFEAARAANGAWPGLHQLAHLQLVDPADAPRLSALGAMANIQPLWARYDPVVPDIALDMIGAERQPLTYPFRSLLDMGTATCLSSDWPVSTLNPFEIIETAVTRQARLADGPKDPFQPQERLTVEDCVLGYTVQAAAACWRGDYTGRLKPGFSGDAIILDQDIFACPPWKISDTKVLLTLFQGREIYRAGWFAG